MLLIIIGLIISYLLGSIPTAYIFCRILKGIDIRSVGSGNVGATNALRVLGKGWGIVILFLDILKGLLPVVLIGNYISSRNTILTEEQVRVMVGLLCICGHNWTVFLNFKGGKGIATTLGVLIGLSFTIHGLIIILCLLILTWITIFLIFRIISLASIISSFALPVYAVILKESGFFICASILLSIFAIVRHKANILRLIQRKEPKLRFTGK